jgi:hypothetical protein
MSKKQDLFIAGMAQLVVRHTFNSRVNEFESADPSGHNALVSSFIDFLVQ